MTDLFSSHQLGPLSLPNRVVMAPMTRSRSIGNIPGEIVATYYAQRSEAGLIVTEGTSPSPNGRSSGPKSRTPNILRNRTRLFCTQRGGSTSNRGTIRPPK